MHVQWDELHVRLLDPKRGALLATRVVARLAFVASRLDHVTHFDTFAPLAYGLAPIALAGIALTACFLPARRATHVDPVVVLRVE